MFFQNRNVYPSNVWFITGIAFNSVGLLRNSYFKLSSNAPSIFNMQYFKIYFSFAPTAFPCLSNEIALKGLFLHHCVVFSLFCIAIVISEPFLARAYFRPDFDAFRRKKFAARCFWFKAKLALTVVLFLCPTEGEHSAVICAREFAGCVDLEIRLQILPTCFESH